MTAVAERGAAAGPRPKRRLSRLGAVDARRGVGIAILSITVTLTGAGAAHLERHRAGAPSRLLLPILLAGLGGLWSERAGVVNIGLEGMMILGTWGAAWAGYQWGPWAALLGGDRLRRPRRAAARGRHGDLRRRTTSCPASRSPCSAWASRSTCRRWCSCRSPRNPRAVAARSEAFDGVLDARAVRAGWPRSRPSSWFLVSDVAGLLGGLVTNLTPLVVIGFALVPLSYYVLWRTRVRAAAALVRREPGGRRVARRQRLPVQVHRRGGLRRARRARRRRAGAHPGQLGYLEGQTGGRGYIGLAAMIFGNWRPGGLARRRRRCSATPTALQLRGGGEAVHALLLRRRR